VNVLTPNVPININKATTSLLLTYVSPAAPTALPAGIQAAIAVPIVVVVFVLLVLIIVATCIGTLCYLTLRKNKIVVGSTRPDNEEELKDRPARGLLDMLAEDEEPSHSFLDPQVTEL
jgi:hypothetical protein